MDGWIDKIRHRAVSFDEHLDDRHSSCVTTPYKLKLFKCLFSTWKNRLTGFQLHPSALSQLSSWCILLSVMDRWSIQGVFPAFTQWELETDTLADPLDTSHKATKRKNVWFSSTVPWIVALQAAIVSVQSLRADRGSLKCQLVKHGWHWVNAANDYSLATQHSVTPFRSSASILPGTAYWVQICPKEKEKNRGE